MTKILIGTNLFDRCDALVAHKGEPLLVITVDGEQVHISLRIPEGGVPLQIKDNSVLEGDAQVVEAPKMTSVIVGDTLVVHAVFVEQGTILVQIDLRPLRLDVYTDASGLHIAGNQLARNKVEGARVAINLA